MGLPMGERQGVAGSIDARERQTTLAGKALTEQPQILYRNPDLLHRSMTTRKVVAPTRRQIP